MGSQDGETEHYKTVSAPRRKNHQISNRVAGEPTLKMAVIDFVGSLKTKAGAGETGPTFLLHQGLNSWLSHATKRRALGVCGLNACMAMA